MSDKQKIDIQSDIPARNTRKSGKANLTKENTQSLPNKARTTDISKSASKTARKATKNLKTASTPKQTRKAPPPPKTPVKTSKGSTGQVKTIKQYFDNTDKQGEQSQQAQQNAEGVTHGFNLSPSPIAKTVAELQLTAATCTVSPQDNVSFAAGSSNSFYSTNSSFEVNQSTDLDKVYERRETSLVELESTLNWSEINVVKESNPDGGTMCEVTSQSPVDQTNQEIRSHSTILTNCEEISKHNMSQSDNSTHIDVHQEKQTKDLPDSVINYTLRRDESKQTNQPEGIKSDEILKMFTTQDPANMENVSNATIA